MVANYDSGKVRRETAGVFVRALRPLRYGALGGMVVAAVFTLLRGVVLSEGAASLVLAVLAGVCLVPSAVLLRHRSGKYLHWSSLDERCRR